MNGENAHRARVSAVSRGIEKLFDEVVDQITPELKRLRVRDRENFSVSRHPSLRRAIDKATEGLGNRLKSRIIKAIETEYRLGYTRGLEGEKNVLKTAIPKEYEKALFARRDSAVDKYVERCEKPSFRLSKSVWEISGQTGKAMRLAIEADIKDGVGFAEMARDIKEFLKDPDSLFRRVRGKDGRLHLSRAARDYHPGRGVYRSAVRNAQRVARSETNIAYRSADCDAAKQDPFVLGIRVNLSANHTTRLPNGDIVPLFDICDYLSNQDYPSGFKFTGWHPHCRCFITYLLVPRAEAVEMLKKGLKTPPRSKPVIALPWAFRNWMEDNAERLEASKSLPYFIRDNRAMIDGLSEDIFVDGLLDRNGIERTEQQMMRVDGDVFRQAILNYKESGAIQSSWQVDVHDTYHDSDKCFLTEDGKSGICVTADGDIVSVFSGVSGDKRMQKLMFTALNNGGVKCDCYADWLQNIYARYGGVATGQVRFNEEYAPDEWKALPPEDRRTPPVVAMIFPKGTIMAARDYNEDVRINLRDVPEYDDYMDMINDRDAMLEE